MRVSVHAVHRLWGPQPGHGVSGGPGVAHVALEQKRRVLVGALGRRKLVLRAGHERLSSVQRGQLVLFVAACVAILAVLSGNYNNKKRQKNAHLCEKKDFFFYYLMFNKPFFKKKKSTLIFITNPRQKQMYSSYYYYNYYYFIWQIDHFVVSSLFD